MRTIFSVWFGITLLVSGGAAVAAEAKADAVIPLRRELPVIDGAGDDACWTLLPWQEGAFTMLATTENAPVQTRFKAFHDGGNLYLFIAADEPESAKMVAEPYGRDSNLLWRNDSVEITLTPDVKALSAYKFIVDSRGTVGDMRILDDNTDRERYNIFADWDGGIELKTGRTATAWTVEARIPFGAMELDDRAAGNWRFNVARNRYAGMKEPQCSSWSEIRRASQLTPRQFKTVALEKFDVRRYKLAIATPDTELRRAADGTLEYAASANVTNNTQAMRVMRLRLTLADATGERFTTVVPANLTKGAFKNLSGVIKAVAPGDYTFSYALYSNNTVPVLLKKITRAVRLEYQPLRIAVRRPAYRNNIYATMPDKNIEVAIELAENVGMPLNVELRDERDTVVAQRKIAAAQAVNPVVFDTATLPDGRYTLAVSGGASGDGPVCEAKFRKLPHQPGEVWLDREGVTHVDGKKILPFGWHASYEQHGEWMNWSCINNQFANPDEAKTLIAKRLTEGCRTAVYPFQDMDPRGWVRAVIFAESKRKQGLTPAQEKKLREFVARVGKSEGLLVWYMADEPEGRDNNPRFYEEALAIIAEIDPYHPGIMLNYGREGMRKYYRGGDILMPDCYPQYFEDGSSAKPLSCTSAWSRTAAELRPAWLCGIAALWPARSADGKLKGVPPGFDDLRSQVFQAVIHNVKGFSFYSWPWSQEYSSLIFGVDEVGKSVQALREYIFKNTVPDAVTAVTRPAVPPDELQFGLKRLDDGRFAVIAVNASNARYEADFTLRNGSAQSLHVAGESRTVALRNGKFTDRFEPRETHIYLSDAALAAAVPDVAAGRAMIAEHRAGRRKPGNRIGLGELLEADLLDFAAGKRPPELPRLTASSDATTYITAKTGSLYYLLDGLTAPRLPQLSWSPNSSDTAPWLEIKLPRAETLHELKLYTPNGNLEACRVTVANRDYEVSGNTGAVIGVKLDGVTGDTVKITILKTKKTNRETPAHLRRLLTEVELY